VRFLRQKSLRRNRGFEYAKLNNPVLRNGIFIFKIIVDYYFYPRAATIPQTDLAPFSFKDLAHSSMVAPVV